MTTKTPKPPRRHSTWRAAVGLSLADGSRVEEGETVTAAALGKSLEWLAADGLIVPADDPTPEEA